MLVDTGPLVAALNRRDAQHQTCRKLLDARAEALAVTPYVVAEVCWLVSSRIGAIAEANVMDAVAAGELRQVTISGEELRRIRRASSTVRRSAWRPGAERGRRLGRRGCRASGHQ